MDFLPKHSAKFRAARVEIVRKFFSINVLRKRFRNAKRSTMRWQFALEPVSRTGSTFMMTYTRSPCGVTRFKEMLSCKDGSHETTAETWPLN